MNVSRLVLSVLIVGGFLIPGQVQAQVAGQAAAAPGPVSMTIKGAGEHRPGPVKTTEDSEAVKAYRNALKSAKASGDPARIKLAEDRLRQEILRERIAKQNLSLPPVNSKATAAVKPGAKAKLKAHKVGSDTIKADRQALLAAKASKNSTAIKAAEDQLTQDLLGADTSTPESKAVAAPHKKMKTFGDPKVY